MNFKELADMVRTDDSNIRVCDVADCVLAVMYKVSDMPLLSAEDIFVDLTYSIMLNLIALSKGEGEALKIANELRGGRAETFSVGIKNQS